MSKPCAGIKDKMNKHTTVPFLKLCIVKWERQTNNQVT